MLHCKLISLVGFNLQCLLHAPELVVPFLDTEENPIVQTVKMHNA